MRPQVSVPAVYGSGTPRDQHPAVARWHVPLLGLATEIHKISGLGLELPHYRIIIQVVRDSPPYVVYLL